MGLTAVPGNKKPFRPKGRKGTSRGTTLFPAQTRASTLCCNGHTRRGLVARAFAPAAPRRRSAAQPAKGFQPGAPLLCQARPAYSSWITASDIHIVAASISQDMRAVKRDRDGLNPQVPYPVFTWRVKGLERADATGQGLGGRGGVLRYTSCAGGVR